jgi:hypothetical protein
MSRPYWSSPSFAVVGYLGGMLDDEDPAPARDQIDKAYRHGGGWNPMPGFIYLPAGRALLYPGDPPMFPISECYLRAERLMLYRHSWLAILQTDGSVEVARVD